MRAGTLIVEAALTARAQRVASVLVALLCGGVCAATLLTVGGTAAAEAQVLGRLDAAGSRLLIVTDTKQAGLVTPATVDVLNSLDTVERAIGVSTPFDVTNAVFGGAGDPIPAWELAGPPRHAVRLTFGRWPGPGEALVSGDARRALGLSVPIGAVVNRSGVEFPIVGAFAAREPFEFLDAGLVVGIPRQQEWVESVHVIARQAGASRITERAVLMTLRPADLSDVRVQSPHTLAELQLAVGGDLGGFGRGLTLVMLGVGGFLVAVVVLAEVLLRRRDLGRRRALGASRPALLGLVVARTVVAATPGLLLGVASGVLAAWRLAQPPPWDFTLGTAVLMLISAAAAATPPALVAAWRDPVAVLRTP